MRRRPSKSAAAVTNHPLRIVHLVAHLNFGGVQEVVKGLVFAQKLRGHDVSILCWEYPGNDPETEQLLAQAGIPVAPARDDSDRRWSSLQTLRKRLPGDPIDVVHIHNPFEYCFYGALAARLRKGTKVVNTLHATAMFDRFDRKHKVFFKAGAMLTNQFVPVCQEIGDVVHTRFGISRSKLCVIDNGVDVSHFLAIPDRVRRDNVIFGAVGRMSVVKNQQLLLRAFALARATHPNIRLRFLGGGVTEVPKLAALAAELGLSEVVEFCPFAHDVSEFLSEIDVFVLPSKSEGLPISLLEAIAAGLPSIATDVGGVRKVIEATGGGRVCPSDDPEAMSQAMRATIDDDDRYRATVKARSAVVGNYSAARMSDDYERVYRSL